MEARLLGGSRAGIGRLRLAQPLIDEAEVEQRLEAVRLDVDRLLVQFARLDERRKSIHF